MALYRPRELAALLGRLGAFAKKSLSQNFLIDGNILDKILAAAEIAPGDLVVEIGPGPGALTEALLARCSSVIAVEKDPLFIDHLKSLSGNLSLYEADILSFPIEEILQRRKAKLVANLPYQITTPILQRFLPLKDCFSSLTLMVQKEFGQRLTAQKNESAYSSLTLFAQYYAESRFCFSVKPSSFTPRPSVDSCVVRLDLRESSPLVTQEAFFKVTRQAFGQRRKMLRRSLQDLFPLKKIEEALAFLGLPLDSRPEQLGFEQFQALADRLKD